MSVQMIKNNINSQSGGRRTPLSLSGGVQASSKNGNKQSDETNIEMTKTSAAADAVSSKADVTIGKKDVDEKKTETPTSPGKSGKTGSKANLITENNSAKDVLVKKAETSKKSERVKKQKNEVDVVKTSNGNKSVDEKMNVIKIEKVVTPPKSKKDILCQPEQNDAPKEAPIEVKIEENNESGPKIEEPQQKENDKKKKEVVEETSPKPKSIMSKDSEQEIKDNDDSIIEMEPLLFEDDVNTIGVCSTPGKILQTKADKIIFEKKFSGEKEKQTSLDTSLSDRPFCPPASYRSITGRRSVRQIQDYHFSSNSFRESYRKINTELDVTNTSLNVTVGSEIPNSSTFSFFERSRKRERTPTESEADGAIGDIESSPKSPKRARLDFSGFFGLVASPMTMLRSRFSRTKIQSTPCKVPQQNQNDGIDVANFSGIAIEEHNNMECDTKDNDNKMLINGNQNSTENENNVENGKATEESDQDVIQTDAIENLQDTNIDNSDINIKIVHYKNSQDEEKLDGKEETNNEPVTEKRKVCIIM